MLLSQHNEVIGVDISQERVDALNKRKSPIIDQELSQYLAEKKLNLSASTNLSASVANAEYVVICTPTDYNEKTNSTHSNITELTKSSTPFVSKSGHNWADLSDEDE